MIFDGKMTRCLPIVIFVDILEVLPECQLCTWGQWHSVVLGDGSDTTRAVLFGCCPNVKLDVPGEGFRMFWNGDEMGRNHSSSCRLLLRHVTYPLLFLFP